MSFENITQTIPWVEQKTWLMRTKMLPGIEQAQPENEQYSRGALEQTIF